MTDLTITLPDRTLLVPQKITIEGTPVALNPNHAADVAVYTRALDLASSDRLSHRTPAAHDRVEYTIVDTRVVGRKTGGSLDIPRNGFVLSFSRAADPSGAFPDENLSRVRYGFVKKAHRAIRQAVQAGPMLLKDRRRVIAAESLADEQFWPASQECTDLSDIGIVPTDCPNDVDQACAGRMGVGVNTQNHLIVVAVPEPNVALTARASTALEQPWWNWPRKA